jgi:hypothetical protein
MSDELEIDPANEEQPKPDAGVPKEEKPNNENSKVDQEMADEYGWTPQQAKESGLYL